MPKLRMAYFALDVPHKGQASYTHIHEIIDNLTRGGWEVDLFAPTPSGDGRWRGMGTRFVQYVGAIFKALSNLHRYDVLYVRAHFLAWPVTAWARCRGRVVAQEVNGTDLDVIVAYPKLRFFTGLVSWLYRSQYRMADQVFPVTHELGDWIREITGHDRVTVVPNAANTDLFRPLAAAGSQSCVVFCGTLAIWYGVDAMLAALSDPRWPKGVELKVIGSGPQAEVVAHAARSGLPVKWLGSQPYDQIPQLIAGAWAGLVPATNPKGRASHGVFPLKLFETLACGMPVVVTDLPGQADFVRKHDCGIVVPPGDGPAIAEAVARIVAAPDTARAMGKRGADVVRAEHSWAARAREIDRVLSGLVEKKRA